MADIPRLYWDTSVFLCLINKDETTRRAICEEILKHAREGRTVICTSMYTIVEVIRPKGIKHPTPLTPAQVAILEGMFKWPFLKKYQVDETLALKAAQLSRETGLKPADAIHAATAIAAGCDVLHRWDRDFDKVKDRIKVEEPKFLTSLPLLDRAQVGPALGDLEPQ